VRVAPPWLAQAQDDATEIAIRIRSAPASSIVTDGETRRESYSNHFARPRSRDSISSGGTVTSRSGQRASRRASSAGFDGHPHGPAWSSCARTNRRIKITVPGPNTMTQLSHNDFYPTSAELALDCAVAVNEEIRDLFAAGAMSCRSTSPTCRRGQTRRAPGGRRIEPCARRHHRHDRGPRLLPGMPRS
jgi:5-methyltetrahydropteroyltriglutamate--homocysteine methyltransferase